MNYANTAGQLNIRAYDMPDACAPAASECVMQTAMRRLAEVNGMLSESVAALDQFNTRMLGAAPQEAPTGGEKLGRSNVLDELHTLIGATNNLAARLRREVNRTHEIA